MRTPSSGIPPRPEHFHGEFHDSRLVRRVHMPVRVNKAVPLGARDLVLAHLETHALVQLCVFEAYSFLSLGQLDVFQHDY